MLHPSTKRLIDTLGERTRQKKVEWAESDSGSITHDTEGYRVEITPEPHTIFLLDALGKELDKVEPHEYNDATDDDDRPYSQFISELFREAHRHARGTERAIELLLAGLADVEEDTTEDTPEAIPEIVDDAPVTEAVLSEIDTLETLPDTQIEEVLPEPDAHEAISELHIEETEPEPEPQVEAAEPNNIWPAAALASNGLANMGNDGPAIDTEAPTESHDLALETTAPETSPLLVESIAEPEPLVAEDITPALSDVPSEIAAQESDVELPEEDTTTEIDTLPEASDPEPLGSIMRFAPDPAAQHEDVASADEPSEAIDAAAEDIPASEPTDVASSDVLQDNDDAARDRLTGFAPVDIDEPASADVPDDTPAETPAPLKQSYSLSGIGAGFGLGAAPSVIQSLRDTDEEETVEAVETVSETIREAAEPATAFIDGTADLPDAMPSKDEDDLSAAATLETEEETQVQTIEQFDDVPLTDETIEKIEAASGGETSGIFTGILQRGRSASDNAEDTITETEDAANKVIDDLADAAAPEDDIKPKTTPRFNPWN